jgi:DNA-binding protein HU-beta
MSKALLISAVQQAAGVSVTKSQDAITAILQTILAELKSSGEFTLFGFGTFSVRDLKAHDGRNPATGAPLMVPESRSVRFKPSAGLRRQMQQTEPAPPPAPQPAKPEAEAAPRASKQKQAAAAPAKAQAADAPGRARARDAEAAEPRPGGKSPRAMPQTKRTKAKAGAAAPAAAA